MEKILSDWKEKLINDGLEECRALLPKQTNTMIPFYEGSIEGFKKCKKFNELKDFGRELDVINRKELNLIKRYHGEFSSKKLLNEIWYVKDLRTQIEFVCNHLESMNYLLKKIEQGE